MRSLLVLPILLLGACQVTEDEQNDTISAEFNQALAENVADDVADTAGNIGAAIVNDVERTGEKIENEVGRTEVDADVDVRTGDEAANRN